MKPINLHKYYTKNNGFYQLKLLLNIDYLIPDSDSVRLLSQFVEEMDLTDLYSTYSRISENQANHMNVWFKKLFKVFVQFYLIPLP